MPVRPCRDADAAKPSASGWALERDLEKLDAAPSPGVRQFEPPARPRIRLDSGSSAHAKKV
jgi:hypothetical protein